MHNEDSVIIVDRFFKTLERLKTEKRIRGIKTFTDKYSIDRRNFNKLKKNMKLNIFQPSWLMYLSHDFGVSTKWLLFGIEPFYGAGYTENMQDACIIKAVSAKDID